MKKLSAVLLCIMMLAMSFAVVPQAAKQKVYVVLGDSIAEGVGSSDKKTKGNAALIAKARGYELANFAVGGIPSETLLKLVREKDNIRKGIKRADIIDISIGGNDFVVSGDLFSVLTRALLFNDYSGADSIVEGFSANFGAIIKEIRKLNPNAKLIVQTLYNPMASLVRIGEVYETAISKLNDCVYEYLKENPGAFLIADVRTAFMGREELVSRDLMHPSDAGHEVIAQVVMDTIDGAKAQPQPAPATNRGFFSNVWYHVKTLSVCLWHWITILPSYTKEYKALYAELGI